MTLTLFSVELPEANFLVDLAPRVRGKTPGDYAGEYGYALSLDQYGQVLVAWDDGSDASEWIPAKELVFLNNGGKS